MTTRGWAGSTVFTRRGWLNPDFTPTFAYPCDDSPGFKMVAWPRFRIKRIRANLRVLQSRAGVSVAQRRRISTLIMGRFARNMMARASGGSVALSRLWPGRTDRLIIAPHDLRTADATRAAEIYAGRFVFAGKIVTCHGRSIFDLEPPSEDWEVALLGFGWLRHLRAADTALTRANARSLVDDWISNPARKRPHRPPRRRAGAPRDLAVVAGAAGARRYRRQILSPLFARADPRDSLSALHDAGYRRRRAAAAGPDRAVLRLALPRQPGTAHPHRDATSFPTNCSGRSCPMAGTSRAIPAR